jgi:hypothetical protein
MKHRWIRNRWRNGPRRHCVPDTLHRSNRSDSANGTGSRSLRITILRALDGQSVDLEAGYIGHLEWHRQAKDTFAGIATRSGH